MLFFLLQTKHLVVDFLWQPEYEWKNKGTFGHLGGIQHAAKHALATFLILIFFKSYWIALLVGLVEGLIHYFIDFFKMNINKEMGYKPDTHTQFWYLLGFDQYLHQICYGVILLI